MENPDLLYFYRVGDLSPTLFRPFAPHLVGKIVIPSAQQPR